MAQGRAGAVDGAAAEFSSAKTFMTGCLLADDIADKLNHRSWPPGSWTGEPRRSRLPCTSLPRLTASTPSSSASRGRVSSRAIGPRRAAGASRSRLLRRRPGRRRAHERERDAGGNAREVFLTSRLRLVRSTAGAERQPGYWQSAHPPTRATARTGALRRRHPELAADRRRAPREERQGARPIAAAGGRAARIIDALAPWENRAQMGRTSARTSSRLLLDDNAMRLQANPRSRGGLVAAGPDPRRRRGR